MKSKKQIKNKAPNLKLQEWQKESEKEIKEIEEEVGIKIPDQTEFYKVPVRFGNIPTDELPIGCTKDEKSGKISYKKFYPLVNLPFQQIEKIPFGSEDLEPNRLIWGDNLHVMRMLPSNSIDLIYIDPPFFSGKNYNIVFGDSNEIRSFTDIWEGGMPGYLTWLNARLVEMWRLLKPTGSIYVHLDWHASHYVKTELDKIFGYDKFRNEIIWYYPGGLKAIPKYFPRKHDIILWYTKTNDWTFNVQRKEAENNALYKRWIKYSKDGKTVLFKDFPRSDKVKFEDYLNRFKAMYKRDPKPNDVFYEFEGALIDSVWDDAPSVFRLLNEKIGYPTQKPEKLLKRIIESTTKPNDVVADFFCGGGTTPTVAQKLGRRWVASDVSRVAIAVTRDRLLISTKGNSKETQQSLGKIPNISVENWGIYEVPKLVKKSDEEFRKFILQAYNARLATIKGLIHGYGNGEIPIYVGSASQEKSISKEEVIDFAKEIVTKKGATKGIMISWGFSPSAKEAVNELESKGTKIELVKIKLIAIESEEFRNHITEKNPQYKNLLKFIIPPQINISSKMINNKEYEFDVSESVCLNPGGKIINVQWDFDYDGKRFISTLGYAFSGFKNEKPTLKVTYKFSNSIKQKIACKVQDSEGGEAIEILELEIK